MKISTNLFRGRFVKYVPSFHIPLEADYIIRMSNLNEAQQWLNEGYNVGIVLRFIVVIELANEELCYHLEEILLAGKKTYTQKSGLSGNKQYFFKCDDFCSIFDLMNQDKCLGKVMAGIEINIPVAPSTIIATNEEINIYGLEKGKINNYTLIEDAPLQPISYKMIKDFVLSIPEIDKSNFPREDKIYDFYHLFMNNFTVPITDILNIEEKNDKPFNIEHPWHDVDSFKDFIVIPHENSAICCKCNTSISCWKAICLNEGILLKCNQSLDFKTMKELSKVIYSDEKYKDFRINFEEFEKNSEYDRSYFNTVSNDSTSKKSQKSYLIEGKILSKGGIHMVFGDKGVFKTTDSLYRAIIMSNGIDSYLGKFKVKEGQVLYLSGENQKEDIEITREAIKKSLGVTKNPYIMHREEVGCILDKEYWRELVKFIVKKDIILVIFDTISIFTDDADLTSPVVSNKILSLFKQLSSLGVTVVYLQHTDKQKKNYMGSMRLAANADTVSRITRDSRQRDVYIIDNQWNRAGEHNKLVVRVNHIEDANGELDKIYFELIDDTKKSTNSSGVFNSAQSVSGVSITNEILNLLGKQSMSRKELTQVLSDKTSESTIDRSISILKEAGKVQTGLNKKYELINNSKSEAKDGNLK